MRILGILQARDGSTRLPRKATTMLGSKIMLQHVWDRLCKVGGLDAVCVSTSVNSPEIVGYCKLNETPYFAGNEEDLLSRHLGAAAKYEADAILRVTGDEVFHDPAILDSMIAMFRNARVADGMSNWADGRTVSEGLDADIVTVRTMQLLAQDKNCPREDWLTHLFKRCQSKFKLMAFRFPRILGTKIHLSVDTPEDLERAAMMFAILGDRCDYDGTLKAYGEVTGDVHTR